ncbi:carcinoembryonic antigen-related cell adhesion molecule 5 [Hoplias malabaricus]|uniref:carcinoembryonic antigen-related cell adhesion molecule 5 n=1 Tax=Hoplias malabaricus TaxID=27720 RepID=UPI0034623068
MRVFLLILTAISCSSGNPLLPSKMSGVKGKFVTFPLSIPASTKVLSMVFTSSPGSDSVPVFAFTLDKGNPDITDQYKGRVTFNQTTYAFQLGPLTQADSGIYSVIVLDQNFFPQSGQTTLAVLEPVADVTVISSPPEVVEFNTTVVLICSAKGSFLSYKWMNGSSPVIIDGIHLMQNESQLIINGVLRTDLCRPIYCTAQNNLESMTSSAFNLSISYGPDSASMTKVPGDSVLKKGSNLTLSCSAVSSPAAELKWFFNGRDLQQNVATLALTNLEENQSGNYSCVAYNSKTKRYTYSQVATVSIIEAISGTNVTGPNLPLIAENSTANLTCRASAGRAHSVSWFKDGVLLVFNEHIIATADKSSISILTVKKEDAGEYRCQLTNSVNSDFSSFIMKINYGPEKGHIEGPKKVEVVERLVMKCLVDSVPPASYIWKLNNTLLELTTSEYTIEKPDYKNSGTYTCEAHNNITGLSLIITHDLLVKGEGELHDQLSDGAIAGIVIAVFLLLCVIACIIVRKRRKPADIASPY